MTAAEIVKALGGDWCGAYGLVPGPGHSRRDRSLKVWEDGDRVLVHSFAGDDWRECRAHLGLDDDWQRGRPSVLRRKAAPADSCQQPDRRAEALAIWEASSPALHTPAQDYLACRGITIAPPACIRYNPAINALVALVQAKDGTFSGIQRVYLAADSCGTWREDRNKLSLGPIKGGAARLTPAAESLQITESVEDGLALLQMTERATWALPGAGFIESLAPPPEVRELVLAPDHDRAGLDAIEKANRFRNGTKLRQLLPPPGKDWCDVLEDYEERMAIEEEPEPPRSWAEDFCNGI